MPRPLLKVNEIFYSLQGEGPHTGMAAVFLRLAGCSMNCPFCDTKYAAAQGREMTDGDIISALEQYPCRNVIVTGGIKVIPEQVEAALAQHLHCPLAVTSVPDGKFGEAVTLLVGTPHPAGDELRQAIAALPPYHRPKHVFMTTDLPHTPNGKIDRAGCRRSARDHAGSTPGNCK